MNITSAYPSKYLKAVELDGDTVYTIDRVEMENVAPQGKPEELKPVAYFNETDQGLVLNRTNSATITSLYGPETDDWSGKPITLFATEVDFAGKQTLAIRVRMKKPTAPGKAPARPAASRPAPSGGASPRANAWAAFCEVTPNLTDDERTPAWTKAVKSIFPTKVERALTADEWQQFEQEIRAGYDETSRDFIPT